MYRLPFKYIYKITHIQHLACDNPASPFGFEDKSIFYKGTKWAKELTKLFGGKDNLIEVTCEFYNH